MRTKRPVNGQGVCAAMDLDLDLTAHFHHPIGRNLKKVTGRTGIA